MPEGKNKECWLCGQERDDVQLCECNTCLEANPGGRMLCGECSNGIYERYNGD